MEAYELALFEVWRKVQKVLLGAEVLEHDRAITIFGRARGGRLGIVREK